ncbi:hypothetical protein, partial [Escherichia coli]|uniref:hypothetical protein n=1 Tax=Escherichia coli TaxID=562 RepID=UPI00215DB94B
DRNRSHWSTSKTPSYTKSVSWQHHLPDGENILIYKVNIINASSKKDVFFYESPTSTHNDIMGGGGMSYAYEYDVKYNICHLRKKSRMR